MTSSLDTQMDNALTKHRTLLQPDHASERNCGGKRLFFICTSSPRRDLCILDLRRPALFVLAPPPLLRFRVALDSPVFRVELQFPVDFPRDVRKLQHRNGDIAYRDRSVELFSFPDSRDEVRKVSIGHGIGSEEISR